VRIMTRNTRMGQKFYLVDKNWDEYEYDYKEYRAAMRARKRTQIQELLAAEIANGNGKPKPTYDLFS
jgi:hypothetical protein